MANVMLGARWLLNSMAYCGPSSYTSENWWPKQREQSLSTGPDSIVILLVQCAVLIKSWWSAQGTELNSDCSVMYAFFTFKTSESQSHFRCGWSDLAWRDFLPQRLAWLGMKRFPTTVRGWPVLAWRDFLPQSETGLTWHEEISCHSQRLAWLGLKRFLATVRGWPDLAWRNFLPQLEAGLTWPEEISYHSQRLAWRGLLPQSEAGLTWHEEISYHSQKVGSSAGRVQPDPGYWLDIDLGKLHYICQWKRKQILWLQIVLLQSMRLETVWTVHIQTCRQHSSMHLGYIHVSETHSSGHILWWPECQGYWGSTVCDWKLNGMYLFTPMHYHVMVWRTWCIFSWTAFTVTPQKDMNVLGTGLQYSSQFPLSLFVWI